MLTITATGRYSKCVSNEVITAGSVGIPAVFNLNEDFDGLSPIAVFRGSDVSFDVALIGSEVIVPHEVLANVGGILEVGVYARNGEGTIVIPTVWSVAGTIREGAIASGVDPSEPTPDWTAQVQAAASEAVQTANDAKDIAENAKEVAITSADSAQRSAAAAAESANQAAESNALAALEREGAQQAAEDAHDYLMSTENYAVWVGQKASEAAASAEQASDNKNAAAVSEQNAAKSAADAAITVQRAAENISANVQESVDYISEAEQTVREAAVTAEAAKDDAETARDEVRATADSISDSVAGKMPIVEFGDPIVAVNTTTVTFFPDADDNTIYTSARNAINFTIRPNRLYKVEWDGVEYDALYFQSFFPTSSNRGTYPCPMIGNAAIAGLDNPYPTNAPFLLALRYKQTELHIMRILTRSTLVSHRIKITAIPFTTTLVSKAYYEQIDASGGRPAITPGGGLSGALLNAGGAAGAFATALGEGTKATGQASVASGYVSKATGAASHAEGVGTIASQGGAHAEGAGTEASGYYSHAEGYESVASGSITHAEGYRTIANHLAQVALGAYNEADPSTAEATAKGTYIELIGNGTSEKRSNARTLDWNGNERLAGGLTLHAGSENEMDIASEISDMHQQFGGMIASVETGDTASKDYAVGDLVVFDNRLYKVIIAIALGDTIILNGNVEQTTVEQEMENAGSGVSDVQVNGSSIVNNGVANIPFASTTIPGVIRIGSGLRLSVNGTNSLMTNEGNQGQIRTRTSGLVIAPENQHFATFYGLAYAAGDKTQAKLSTLNYTESAKSAIHEMLNGPVEVTGTTPVITALPGISYKCGEVATLDITLPATGIVDVVFTSGTTPTVLTVTPPTGVTLKWANGFDPDNLDADMTYEINICDGLGVAAAWT